MPGRGVAVGLLAGALLALLSTSTAGAAVRPKLKVGVKPAVAAPGATVTVSGRVTGRVRVSRRKLRVVLEERVGRRWIRRVAVKPSKRLRFAARWRLPSAAGQRTLRVRLMRGKRALATSSAWRLTVSGSGPPAPGPGSPAPSPGSASSPGPAPVAAQTQVLASSVVEAAPAPGASGVLRLSGDLTVRAGDVLASGIGTAAPHGFLLKATGVRSEDGDTLVDVVQATLLEAIPEAEVHESFTFEPATTARRRGATPDTGIRFSKQVDCEAEGTVTIEGSADLGSPEYTFDADWGLLKLNSVEATASVTASASASASATGAASCTVGPIKLFETKLAPVTFVIATVPVVLVPEIEIELAGLGEVAAAVGTSVDASLTARAGARWEDGDLSPIAELEESFDHQPPNPEANARLAATLSSELEVAAYGVGGPAFNFDAGLELNADTEASPWWTLDAPIAFTAGFDIDILDIEVGPITVYEKRFRLAQAEGATAEAELELSISEQASAPPRDGVSCNPREAQSQASGTLRARSTRRVQLQPSGDGWFFSFGETDPTLTGGSLSGAQSVECLGPDGYYDNQSWTLITPGDLRFVYDEGTVYRDYRFVLPEGLRGQPIEEGGAGDWVVTGAGPFGTSTHSWWPGHTSTQQGPDQRDFPTPPVDTGAPGEDVPDGNKLAMRLVEPGPGSRSALPGSITEPTPGTIVIQGGSAYTRSSSQWEAREMIYDGIDGAATATITARWKITVREGERPPEP